jgi:hypothetical protein
MGSSTLYRQKRKAILTGVMWSASLQAGWALVWWLAMALLSFMTDSPAEASKNAADVAVSVLCLPAAVIPIVYLSFVARSVASHLADDDRAGRLAFAIAMTAAVVLSLMLSWLGLYGYL